MNVNVNVKGLHFANKKISVNKKRVDAEIEKLLRSSMNDNADEVAQFQADPFIAVEFHMAWPKPKLPKEAVRGSPEAGDLPGHRECPSPYKMDDNHNRQDCAAIESAHIPVLDIPQSLPPNETKVVETKPVDLIKVKTRELNFLLKESYEAYSLSQYNLAANKYKIGWEMITDATLKLQTEHINPDVVCYMLCLSLLETNQLNNLLEAVELLVALEKRSSHVFPAVYYALSKAHYKHYRFDMALQAVQAGFAFLDRDVELPEHVIPGTDIKLKESTKDGLSISLAAMKDECSKWHPPDAVCCMGECLPSSRWYGPNRDIYFSDPAFNGMVVLTCNNTRFPCTMRFHQACWKSKKDQLSPLAKLSDKDIIGHECFTPNCEYNQDTRSVITKVEVYGDDAKLKTHIEPPTNPVVWTKRKPSSKGAIPKQQVKVKRLWEKPRRPVVKTVPRSSCKEVTGENGEEMEWRLAKLAKLRESKFGIKPGCEWRPDVAMYGNPQMMELDDYLGSRIFENDSSELAARKTFIFSYFYEFIKENGCVKREQIIRKWNDDRIIFDNTSNVLDGATDICDFLLQSYKLVSLGDRIGTAENLPELYAVVRREICHCVRFVLTDPHQAQAAIAQEHTSNAVVTDHDEKQKQLTTSIPESDPKIEVTDIETPPVAESSPPLQHEGEAANGAHTWPEITPFNLVEAVEKVIFKSGRLPNRSRKSITQATSSFAKTKSSNDSAELEEALVFRLPAKLDNSKQLDEIPDLNPNDAEDIELGVDSRDFRNDSQPVLNGQERGEYLVEMGSDSKEKILPEVCSLSKKSELTNGLRENVFDQESHTPDSDTGNYKLDSMADFVTEMNQDFKTSSNNIDDSDAAHSGDEENSLDNTFTAEEEFPKGSAGEKSDCESLAESNVEKIEQDLATMVKTVAQLKSVLEQNQTRSENHARMLEQELTSHKIVSQESMSELIKDLSRLETRCARLESEKSEIKQEFEKCELHLRQAKEENVDLRLENAEWMHKYNKLTEEKADIEHNLNLLMKEKSAVENNLESLQKERDKMDKKLQKYQTRLKEKIDAELAIAAKKMEGPTEQELQEARLSERKLKLQSLSQEFSINHYALEKAFEKCYDHVTMLNEVGNLISVVAGQQFIMAEAQMAWRDTDYLLRHTMGQYKEDYLKLKQLLESDNEIENLDNVKLPTLNIVFPKLPNLTELYYKEKAKFIPPPPPHGLPSLHAPQGAPHLWAQQGLDPRYFSPPPGAFYPRQNLDPRANDARNPTAAPFPCSSGAYSYPRGPNDDFKGAGIQKEPRTVTPKLDGKLLSDDSSTHDAEEGASQIRRSTSPTKKAGRDLLIQELKKKFVGVPEYDLMESVRRVRNSHNNTLSGMRIQDIVREAEPFVNQLQGRHLAFYLPTKYMLPPQRRSLHPNKPNQRKLPPPMLSGQQKTIRAAVKEPVNRPENRSTKVRPVSPAVVKKPAWAPVKSCLVEWEKNQEESECSICFDRMNLHPVYALPCQHSFHTKCIKKWLGENSVCPFCKIHCTMDDEFPPLPQ